MNKFDLAIIFLLLSLLLFTRKFKKIRKRSFNDSFMIGICGASYMLVVTSMIELLFALPENMSNDLNDTSFIKNATVLFISSILFCISAKDSLTDNKRSLAQDLGISEEVTQKLNNEGVEKLLAYANDLIASGNYESPPTTKEKSDCDTMPSDNKCSQVKQYHVRVKTKTDIVNHYDISVEEITHKT